MNEAYISGAEIDTIESHHLWHFFPDTIVLAIGSYGYAFPLDQERGEYATAPADPAQRRTLPAEKIAAFALKQLCRGVIWNYSEPATSAPFVREVLQNARAVSRYTALRTTGYMTLETLDSFGPYLDGLSLDLRGFSESSYQRLAGISDWQGILDVAERAHHHWRTHIEIVTRIHHGVNDDPAEMQQLVDWIGRQLGHHIPWHILPGDRGSTSAAAVGRTRRLALESGLQFVYGPEPVQATRCPQCQTTLITREQRVVRLVGLDEGHCRNCGFKPYIRRSIFDRHRTD